MRRKVGDLKPFLHHKSGTVGPDLVFWQHHAAVRIGQPNANAALTANQQTIEPVRQGARTMRSVVIVLAVLAGLKVWSQDHLYRSAMNDALVVAYRDRAAQTCFEATDPSAFARATKIAGEATNPWASNTRAPEITIGNPATDVAFWDVDNPLWDVRFRHPHILLGAADKGPCSFNVVAGVARLAAPAPMTARN